MSPASPAVARLIVTFISPNVDVFDYFGNIIVSTQSIKVKIPRLTLELNRKSLRNNSAALRVSAPSALNRALGQAAGVTRERTDLYWALADSNSSRVLAPRLRRSSMITLSSQPMASSSTVLPYASMIFTSTSLLIKKITTSL